MLRNVGSRVGGRSWRHVVDLAISSPPQTPFNLLTRRASPLASTTIPTSPLVLHRAIRTQPRLSRSAPTSHVEDGVTSLATAAWRARGRSRVRPRVIAGTLKLKGRRYDSSKSHAQETAKKTAAVPRADPTSEQKSGDIEKAPITPQSQSQSQSNVPLLERLPHFHRPSKDEVLAAATGFFSRLKAHFKWYTIRSARPYTIDEIYALFSWILVGHALWIILGTTTFVSLILLLVNTVFAQETLARAIGNYLTKSSGIKVVFESAIVPKWKDGVISFKKVFVSRRPGQRNANVSKGSATSAAAAAAAALTDRNTTDEEEDTNYTQFDVSIDTVNVTLSFAKWWNGKGLLGDVEVKGVRGVIDRTSVRASTEPIDPKSYRHEHNTGDFELDSFKLEDLLVTVYQPNNFRPFSVSVYSCHLPQLRKQWLFYDFLSANMMSGSFDNSLFTIHPRQTHNYTGAQLIEGRETGDGPTQWKKHSRIRIDGLNIDHLNRGTDGPFSWIHEGNVDIVADVMLPNDNDGSIAKVMSDFYDRVEATVASSGNLLTGSLPGERHEREQTPSQGAPATEISEPESAPEVQLEDNIENNDRFIVMDLRVHLNDVRAAVPLFTNDISYVNNALVRPIVAYINSRKTFIPVNCRIVKRMSDFDGAWSAFDSGLMDDLSLEVYEAFARDVTDNDEARKRRFKKVGIWTLQLAAQALFIGLAGNIA